MDDKQMAKTQAEKIARPDMPQERGWVKFLMCTKCGYVLLAEESTCSHCMAGTVAMELLKRPTSFIDVCNLMEWDKLRNG